MNEPTQPLRTEIPDIPRLLHLKEFDEWLKEAEKNMGGGGITDATTVLELRECYAHNGLRLVYVSRNWRISEQ